MNATHPTPPPQRAARARAELRTARGVAGPGRAGRGRVLRQTAQRGGTAGTWYVAPLTRDSSVAHSHTPPLLSLAGERTLLALLLHTLHSVSQHAHSTHMSLHNLAVVFAPSLVRLDQRAQSYSPIAEMANLPYALKGECEAGVGWGVWGQGTYMARCPPRRPPCLSLCPSLPRMSHVTNAALIAVTQLLIREYPRLFAASDTAL
jgi:hypothetical protein